LSFKYRTWLAIVLQNTLIIAGDSLSAAASRTGDSWRLVLGSGLAHSWRLLRGGGFAPRPRRQPRAQLAARFSPRQRGLQWGGPLRRSTKLTGKPVRSHLVQFPQITDAEDDSGDDGVVYDFRWSSSGIYARPGIIGELSTCRF